MIIRVQIQDNSGTNFNKMAMLRVFWLFIDLHFEIYCCTFFVLLVYIIFIFCVHWRGLGVRDRWTLVNSDKVSVSGGQFGEKCP